MFLFGKNFVSKMFNKIIKIEKKKFYRKKLLRDLL